jgi:hypothetical protein
MGLPAHGLQWIALLLTALFAGLGPAAAADAPIAWVQFAADGGLAVRAVVGQNESCPAVTSDKGNVVTQLRGAPTGAFPIQVCEALLPANTAGIAVAGRALPSVPAAVRRIAVIGDTGCRVKGRTAQNCLDPKAWPFPAIAAAAAARKPDLVIHVGDYYYRENACPPDHAGCAGSPFGDRWPTWRAEFFDPAAPLFDTAPWLLIRGNHESCKRGGRGWFRLLDPSPVRGDCVDYTPPYRVAAGELELLPFDDAEADDFLAPPDKVTAYAAQLTPLLAKAAPHSWLVMHRPVWAMGPDKLGALRLNQTMQQAIRDRVPANLDMVLSGHIHDFISYAFGPERPAQLIVGTGGDNLDKLPGDKPADFEIDGMPVRATFATRHFGYFIMDRAGDGGWNGVLYAPDDTVLGHCRINDRDIACK